MDPISDKQYDEADRWVTMRSTDGDILLVYLRNGDTEVVSRFHGIDDYRRAMCVCWAIKEAIYDGLDPHKCLNAINQLVQSDRIWNMIHGAR